ncbi:MAG: hypothetical protein MN733_28580 [Nitrososphaera sp.]|nr:hypothetical protein [Nitrososphaera sp.]
MKGLKLRWEKLGRILKPDPGVWWMSTCTGSAFAVLKSDSSLVDIYITGRDTSNRSLIGRVEMALDESPRIINISSDPVLWVGSLGAFDENGVSYPCLVKHENRLYLYYTGWMPTVLTPFQNHLGLAIQQEDGTFERVSRAPILERTNEDYLSVGSVYVLADYNRWQMWYTSFVHWGTEPAEPKHRYVIKYATSENGIRWNRENKICINISRGGEHSICRPTVYRHGDSYHMWYSYRGEYYRIGYAYSKDGISWQRTDIDAGLSLSDTGWDSDSQAYPNVFKHGGYLYMLYCGNDYGREGLGLARLKLDV